jgi:hypothetical protein
MIDIEGVASIVRIVARVPDIEVDESDGYVTMRWSASNRDTFALIFNGKHEVIGVHTPIQGHGCHWKCFEKDENKLLERLADTKVSSIIRSR